MYGRRRHGPARRAFDHHDQSAGQTAAHDHGGPSGDVRGVRRRGGCVCVGRRRVLAALHGGDGAARRRSPAHHLRRAPCHGPYTADCVCNRRRPCYHRRVGRRGGPIQAQMSRMHWHHAQRRATRVASAGCAAKTSRSRTRCGPRRRVVRRTAACRRLHGAEATVARTAHRRCPAQTRQTVARTAARRVLRASRASAASWVACLRASSAIVACPSSRLAQT